MPRGTGFQPVIGRQAEWFAVSITGWKPVPLIGPVACAVATLFMVGVVAKTSAQPIPAQPAAVVDAPAPSRVDTLIADLDAPDWSVRQRATEALMLEPSATLRALAQAHNAPDASLETRQRLKRALQHRLLAEMLARFPEHPNGPAEPPDALGPAEPREAAAAWQAQLDAAVLGAPPDAASLGIMHPQIAVDAVPDREGVEVLVLDTLPGFPAYPVLRPGDAIVRFAGNPLPP